MEKVDEDKSAQDTFHRIVNNKNNLEALFLRRLLSSYKREVGGIVRRIEQERLDWMEFFKRVKTCESDSMPEFEKIHRSIRENPPSPIQVPPITERVQVPQMPALTSRNPSRVSTNTDIDGGRISARLITTAPGKRKASPSKEFPQLVRSKTDIPAKRIPKLDMSLSGPRTSRRQSAGHHSITEEEMRDVLMSLPTIDTTRSRIKHNGNVTDRSHDRTKTQNLPNLRKSTSEIQINRVTKNTEKKSVLSLSMSEIPDAVIQEAKDTVISVSSFGSLDDLESIDSAFANLENNPRHKRRPAKIGNAKDDELKIQDKLGTFYKSLDSWTEDTKKRRFPDQRRSSILIDLRKEMSPGQPQGQPQTRTQNQAHPNASARKPSFPSIFL